MQYVVAFGASHEPIWLTKCTTHILPSDEITSYNSPSTAFFTSSSSFPIHTISFPSDHSSSPANATASPPSVYGQYNNLTSPYGLRRSWCTRDNKSCYLFKVPTRDGRAWEEELLTADYFRRRGTRISDAYPTLALMSPKWLTAS